MASFCLSNIFKLCNHEHKVLFALKIDLSKLQKKNQQIISSKKATSNFTFQQNLIQSNLVWIELDCEH